MTVLQKLKSWLPELFEPPKRVDRPCFCERCGRVFREKSYQAHETNCKRVMHKGTDWWFVSGLFTDGEQQVTWYILGPKVTIDDLDEHVRFVKGGDWKLSRFLRDEPWYSTRLVFTQGDTVEKVLVRE